MSSEKIYIIDEADQEIVPGYDLLQDTSFNMEDTIEITEKKLPGQKVSFNNIADKETKEVTVTGLVLNFSQDTTESKLHAILGRTDIEHLYLYADTIIIDDKLSFPQANITISCRHLIIDEQGTLSTTPEQNAQPYAVGNGGDNRKAGAAGEAAGNITLLCHTIENKRATNDAVFLLNGAKGQNGEMGALKKLSPKNDYPLAWSDIEKAAMSFDVIKGTTANWYWPDIDQNKKDKIYYAKIESINYVYSMPFKKHSCGDDKLANQDSGADAIASGAGGNGGAGGKIGFLKFNSTGKKVSWETKGGEEGKSIKIEGGKKAKDSTYYHISIRIYHTGLEYEAVRLLDFKKEFLPKSSIDKELRPVDGKDAKGPDGQKGADGGQETLPETKYSWLQPILLETMLGYAKANFRNGERRKAKWILDHYNNAIKQLPAGLQQDMRMASLIRETGLYMRRLDQNLDFYGYPPGWIPKLSALSNLNIIVESRRELAQLLYFANRLLKQDTANKLTVKDLDWTVKELKKGIKTAQVDITEAFANIKDVKDQIYAVEGQVTDRLRELRDLKKKILLEIEDKARAQALFTGSFEILAGVCSLIPVGQPYLGQLGGGIMKQISKIDIDAENPVKEGLSFAGKLSGEVGGFMEKNQSKISNSANSALTKEIDKGTKELNAFTGQTETAEAELREAEKALGDKFTQQEISLLREKIRLVQNANINDVSSNDYGEIVGSLDELQQTVKAAKDITTGQKQKLEEKLAQLKTDKKTLADKLKTRKAEKEKREKNIETAGKVIKGLTEGITGISSGIQKMMVEFDENDPAVQKKMEAIKNSKYKQEFESINNKIADINKVKLPLVEKLLHLEQKISDGVQRINSNLVQWSVLSDQLVTSVQYGLQPATRISLKRIVQDSWDLLMMECYYLTKSYQYRFLKRIDPVQHGLQKLLEDIEKFLEGKNKADMTEDDYKKMFDTILKGQFKRLAFDLLVNKQAGMGSIDVRESKPVIDGDEKNRDGQNILESLNTYRRVNFRLDDITSSKQATDSWRHYRIVNITFTHIKVKADNPDKLNAAFDFGIRHSGDSIIRAANNTLYYFTSRSNQQKLIPKNEKNISQQIDLQVQSWNASYNGADRNEPNKGLTNAVESVEDDELLNKLLEDFDLKQKYDDEGKPYKSHYPGGNANLTLIIYDDAKKLNYKIEEIGFKVVYEVLK
ncbi:hypothetical protein ACFGVR_02915 [Mucilaginibacter sp. AW1-3]